MRVRGQPDDCNRTGLMNHHRQLAGIMGPVRRGGLLGPKPAHIAAEEFMRPVVACSRQQQLNLGFADIIES